MLQRKINGLKCQINDTKKVDKHDKTKPEYFKNEKNQLNTQRFMLQRKIDCLKCQINVKKYFDGHNKLL